MQIEIAYTSLARSLIALIDAGERVPFDEAHRQCEDGNVLAWLKTRFPFPALDLGFQEHDPTAWADINEQFQSLANAVDAKRKFGVENDDLTLLTTYCIEAIQQLVGHP